MTKRSSILNCSWSPKSTVVYHDLRPSGHLVGFPVARHPPVVKSLHPSYYNKSTGGDNEMEIVSAQDAAESCGRYVIEGYSGIVNVSNS